MSRLGLLNMFLGFFFIFLASCFGAFLANDSSFAIIQNKEFLLSWSYILSRSAHAHTNLFGMLHILFGLTLPYSPFSNTIKGFQTLGFLFGTLAMSVLLLLRSSLPVPIGSIDFLGIVVGFFLSCHLLALAAHCFALFSKFYRTPS